MLKVRIIAYLHYRYRWPLYIPEFLGIIPEEWKSHPSYATYDPVWSWCHAQFNVALRRKVRKLIESITN